jgi:uncharacterized membrane protein YeaQ/YmgE (transglycosylase-associated protein family)
MAFEKFREGMMGIVAWILLGLVAGWLAGQFMKGGGYGLVGDRAEGGSAN